MPQPPARRQDALVERLARQGVDEADANAVSLGFKQVRLQLHQKQSRAGLPYSNRLDPETLNHLDRRILRESFRQAQRLQSSLALRYQL